MRPRSANGACIFSLLSYLGLIFALFPDGTYSQRSVSQDSALAYLKALCVDIGPRPMGSPNERRAMEFAAKKFTEFGLRPVSIMEIESTPASRFKGPTITNSGVVVAVLKGASDRMILIGGHIDSAGPDIPGANDDGSGSAVVLELARALAGTRHEHTLVFCLFGGEESGLQGSKYFVEHFRDLSNIDLMLQIDMANGSDRLVPLTDVGGHSAPFWLVRAAYEEFRALGYSGLSYPTHFLTLNNALPGGTIGSDHQPFLQKNIPAIDFTSDINDPIHTPQDNLQNFQPSGLKRSAELVLRLVERFDRKIPPETSGSYYLIDFLSEPLFVPPWLVTLIVVASCLAGLGGILVLRGRRTEAIKSSRPKIPGLKLFALMLIIQTCVWFSENVVGMLKGSRYPWFASQDGYFLLGFFAACVGIWCSLQFVPALKLSRDPYRWYLRAVVMLLVLTLLFSLASIKLAMYPAVALFCFACVAFVPHPVLKFLFWAASPHLMYRLIFSEAFGLFSHTLPHAVGDSALASFFLHLFLILFFSIWSFPFLLAFASLYYGASVDVLWLKRFRNRSGLAVSTGAFIITAIILALQPSYSDRWSRIVGIDERIDANTQTGQVFLRSVEFLSGVKVERPGGDSVLSSRDRSLNIMNFMPDTHQVWISATHAVTATGDTSGTMSVLTTLRCRNRPYTLSATYRALRGRMDMVETPLAAAVSDREIKLSWYSFPDSVLLIPVHFATSGVDSIRISVEATFVEQAIPIHVSGTNIQEVLRTTVALNQILQKPIPQ